MKKMNLCVALLMAGTLLFAQDPKYGLKAGLNLATLTGDGVGPNSIKAGIHFGALAHVHITPAFSLQPEVYYSNQGTRVTLIGANTKSSMNLNYINIPVLLQYNFDNGFRLQGGPQLGILLEAKNKVGNVEYDYSGFYKTLDFSVPVGLSYLGYSGFGVDARYNIGISNISDVSNSPKIRNSVIQLGLFYLFDHHHKARTSGRRK